MAGFAHADDDDAAAAAQQAAAGVDEGAVDAPLEGFQRRGLGSDDGAADICELGGLAILGAVFNLADLFIGP